MLQQIATTAFQTVLPALARRELAAATVEVLDARIGARRGGTAQVLNTCLPYAADRLVVRRRRPHLDAARNGGA